MAKIVVRLDSEFNETAARAANREAQRYWERQAAHMAVNAKLNEAQARKVTGEAKAYYLRQAAEFKVEAKLSQTSARQVVRDAERIGKDASRAMSAGLQALTPAADGAAASLTGVSKAAASIGPAAAVALPVLAAGLVQVAGVAASAAQSLWLLPAAAGAGAAALGTLALGTQGFGDALKNMGDPKKFAEDLRSLAPSAQEAATSIKTLVDGPIKGLQQATQQELFANFGPQLEQLSATFMPAIQNMTTGIAGAFNDMFSGVANQLMTPETQGALQEFMSNTVAAFRQLAPAAAPLTKALADIMAVGSGVLPDLARAATDAANSFGQFIAEARQSGDLKRWLDEGLETLRLLGGMAIDAGKAFMTLAPVGREVLPLIATGFKAISVAIGPVANLIGGLGVGARLFGTSIDSVVASVVPKINQITGALNALMAPIRAAASLIGIDIAPIAAIAQPSQAQTGQGSTVSENRTSRRPVDLPSSFTAPSSPTPGWGLGAYDRRPGWNPSATPSSARSSSGSPSVVPAAAYTAPSASGYPGDAALLANVPAGRYDASGDLAKGLGDCSSAVEDLVNIMDGRPTGGRSMATGNAAEWLTAHGFLPGTGGPGDFRVGFNAGHMQATLPGGTPFNWGTDAAAARRGIGGTGADDPAFTSHFYRPGTGMPGAAQPFAGGSPAGQPIPVFVTNWDGAMTAAGAQSTQFASGGGQGPGGAGGQGQFDPLGSFFSGLQQGGGIGGIVGGIGNNILGQVRQQTFDDGGLLEPGVTIARNDTGRPEQVVAPSAPLPPGAPGSGQHTGSGKPPGPTPTGDAEPAHTPGGGQSGGGLAGAATAAAATAADMFAPGSGAAVQIASQEIQRAIKFGGQATAIGIGGVIDTLLPFGGSELAQNNWATRIAGGFADVQPSIPNTAGRSASVDAMNKTEHGAGQTAAASPAPPVSSGQGSGPAPGPTVVNNITYTSNGVANDPSVGDMADHLRRGYASIPATGR